MKKAIALLFGVLIVIANLFVLALPIGAASPVPVGVWRFTRSLSVPRAHLGVVRWGSYLYAVGGETSALSRGQYYDIVERATIGPDGSLTAWQVMTSTLVTRRSQFGIALWGDYLYVAGGTSDVCQDPGFAMACKTIERTHINLDGTLEPWQVISTEVGYYADLAAVAYGGNLYLVGGYTPGVNANSRVYRLSIQSNGSLGTHINEPVMTMPRSYFPAFVARGYLYAIGGINTPYSVPGIERARVQADGSLAAWQVVNPDYHRNKHGVAVLGNYLYVVGGGTMGSLLGDEERAVINPDGSLGPFNTLASLNTPRFSLGVATNGDYLYAVGGVNAAGAYLNSVECMKTLPYLQFLPFVTR